MIEVGQIGTQGREAAGFLSFEDSDSKTSLWPRSSRPGTRFLNPLFCVKLTDTVSLTHGSLARQSDEGGICELSSMELPDLIGATRVWFSDF